MLWSFSIFIILLYPLSSLALELKCYSECRFFKPTCKKSEAIRVLSSDKKRPSIIYSDSIIYCDIDGTLSENGKQKYSLLITGDDTDLEVVKEKVIHFQKGENIKSKLKFDNFTFSNQYSGQKVQVRFGETSKTFFFNGINTH